MRASAIAGHGKAVREGFVEPLREGGSRHAFRNPAENRLDDRPGVELDAAIAAIADHEPAGSAAGRGIAALERGLEEHGSLGIVGRMRADAEQRAHRVEQAACR